MIGGISILESVLTFMTVRCAVVTHVFVARVTLPSLLRYGLQASFGDSAAIRRQHALVAVAATNTSLKGKVRYIVSLMTMIAVRADVHVASGTIRHVLRS